MIMRVWHADPLLAIRGSCPQARVGAHCIIGAGTVITQGKAIPDNAVVMGRPGKVVRIMPAEDAVLAAGAGAVTYRQNAVRFRDSGIGLPGDTKSKL